MPGSPKSRHAPEGESHRPEQKQEPLPEKRNPTPVKLNRLPQSWNRSLPSKTEPVKTEKNASLENQPGEVSPVLPPEII